MSVQRNCGFCLYSGSTHAQHKRASKQASRWAVGLGGEGGKTPQTKTSAHLIQISILKPDLPLKIPVCSRFAELACFYGSTEEQSVTPHPVPWSRGHKSTEGQLVRWVHRIQSAWPWGWFFQSNPEDPCVLGRVNHQHSDKASLWGPVKGFPRAVKPQLHGICLLSEVRAFWWVLQMESTCWIITQDICIREKLGSMASKMTFAEERKHSLKISVKGWRKSSHHPHQAGPSMRPWLLILALEEGSELRGGTGLWGSLQCSLLASSIQTRGGVCTSSGGGGT